MRIFSPLGDGPLMIGPKVINRAQRRGGGEKTLRKRALPSVVWIGRNRRKVELEANVGYPNHLTRPLFGVHYSNRCNFSEGGDPWKSKRGDLWKSNKVKSPQPLNTVMKPKPLRGPEPCDILCLSVVSRTSEARSEKPSHIISQFVPNSGSVRFTFGKDCGFTSGT